MNTQKDYKGQNAVQQMMAILSAPHHSACRNLVQEIGAFLGDHLMLRTYDTLPYQPKGLIAVYGKSHPEQVCMRLTLDSGQVTECLAHELLHADLLRRGFPWTNSAKSMNAHRNVFNNIHHEMMLEPYLKLDMAKMKFYDPGEVTTKTWISNEFHYRQPPFSEYDWLFLWFTDWQTWRQMGCEKYKFWNSAEWREVLDAHPKLEGMTRGIEEWFAQGEYCNPIQFETTYNELVLLMGMEPEDDKEWFRLRPGEGHPIKEYTD